MLIVDVLDLSEKERKNLPYALVKNMSFDVYDTNRMEMMYLKGYILHDMFYQGEKINGYTYNPYFNCYDYDRNWYKGDFLIKNRDESYSYMTDEVELLYKNGLLSYRPRVKYSTNEFVSFRLSNISSRKDKGEPKTYISFSVVAENVRESDFLAGYKNFPLRIKLLMSS